MYEGVNPTRPNKVADTREELRIVATKENDVKMIRKFKSIAEKYDISAVRMLRKLMAFGADEIERRLEAIDSVV